MKIMVTGGCGFIGSALVRRLILVEKHSVVNVDKLTYAATPEALASVSSGPRYSFEHCNVSDQSAMEKIFSIHQPEAVFHLAAESHVDRSIDSPDAFINTNVFGTYSVLEAARIYLDRHPQRRHNFKFIHISTDEVFGDLDTDEEAFSETSPYKPNSPYSASKAASDHLVRAWCATFGLPAVVTNCSNNYGPWQAPEKLIPVVITNLVNGRSIPIYGDGRNIRDWLHVEDHIDALLLVLKSANPGSRYNIGGSCEVSNLDLVNSICEIMDLRAPRARPHSNQITFVKDRLGHDRRYAVNSALIESELGWRKSRDFASGLEETVAWYLENQTWWKSAIERFSATPRG